MQNLKLLCVGDADGKSSGFEHTQIWAWTPVPRPPKWVTSSNVLNFSESPFPQLLKGDYHTYFAQRWGRWKGDNQTRAQCLYQVFTTSNVSLSHMLSLLHTERLCSHIHKHAQHELIFLNKFNSLLFILVLPSNPRTRLHKYIRFKPNHIPRA